MIFDNRKKGFLLDNEKINKFITNQIDNTFLVCV